MEKFPLLLIRCRVQRPTEEMNGRSERWRHRTHIEPITASVKSVGGVWGREGTIDCNAAFTVCRNNEFKKIWQHWSKSLAWHLPKPRECFVSRWNGKCHYSTKMNKALRVLRLFALFISAVTVNRSPLTSFLQLDIKDNNFYTQINILKNFFSGLQGVQIYQFRWVLFFVILSTRPLRVYLLIAAYGC